MSMHSLHGCDVSRIAVLIFSSLCIFQRVVSSFFSPLFFQVEQRALLLQMPAVSFSSFYSFIFFILQFPNELVYKVQVLSIA